MKNKFILLTLLLINLATSKDAYNFLLITDIHDKVDIVKKIYLKEQEADYDYVLLLGDAVTVPPGKEGDPDEIKKYSAILRNILLELEKIAPVIWIPGNHEPAPSYDPSTPEYSARSENIHKKARKLEDDLYFVGLGGSTPILEGGKYSKYYVPFSTLNYSAFKYSGYPYNVVNDYEKSDAAFDKDLTSLLKDTKEKYNDPQMILMTHEGLSYVTTTMLLEGGGIMYMGSKKLGEKFEDETYKILVDMHGHTHSGKGFATLNYKRYVINPGAAQNCHYSTMRLMRNIEGKWYVERAEMKEVYNK